jgi:preprotein translocase subunit SecE
MGKLKDGTQAAKSSKPSSGGGASPTKRQFVAFLANLTRVEPYKPLQGRRARLWTGVGLGTLVGAGLYRLWETLGDAQLAVRFGVPVALAVVLGWLVYRLLQFPPFVEFLIATEAEMNKVSWTSKQDLYRATIVVLVTVALMAIYLFGVDWLWSFLLQRIGVLRFSGGGAFGSQAG